MSLLEPLFASLNAVSRRVLVLCAAFCVCACCASAVSSNVYGQDDLDLAAAIENGPDGAQDAGAASADAKQPSAGASEDAESDADGSGGEKKQNYLSWMFHALGWFFTLVFGLLSLAMVALIVMNVVSLRRSEIAPEELTEQFGELLDENKFQEAYELAKDDESLLGRVLSTGLARMPAGFEKATQAMMDVEQEETMRLEHQLGYLALIGNLAPMIGLFGTVVGMIASFQAIAAGGAAPSPQKLAEGIATALFTTELGLAIALPALAAFDILKNRLARFILDVSVISDNYMGRFSNVEANK